MAFTCQQLEALESAIASGTLELRIGDKTIRYQNMMDLMRARDLIKEQLDCGNAGVRTSVTSFSRD